jgi:hypothetical protein
MKFTKKLMVPNSLLMVMDRNTGEIPASMAGRSIFCTSTSIIIGTLPVTNGETEISLADERPNEGVGSLLKLVLSCEIAVPNKKLSVCTTSLKELVVMPLHGTNAAVEIWANHEHVPSIIWVAVLNGKG